MGRLVILLEAHMGRLVMEFPMIATPPMDSQVGMEMAILRAIDWDHHWEQRLDLYCEAPLMEF